MDSTTNPFSATESAPNSPTLNFANDTEHDELDGGGSDFSWSSLSPEADIPPTPEGTSNAVSPNQPSADEVDDVEAATVQAEVMREPIRKHPTHFWECISFLVEGVEFQLPKYKFVEESQRFMDIVTHGVSLEFDSPIELDSISLCDFESFLKAFLPRSSAMYDEKPELTKEEWIAVLKLSTRWFFNDLRHLAITHLSAIEMCDIERICLAKEYKVYRWLLDGYEQIIDRLTSLGFGGMTQTLSVEEGMRIGMDVALKLSGIVILRLKRVALNLEERMPEESIIATLKDEFAAVHPEGTEYWTKREREDMAIAEAQREAMNEASDNEVDADRNGEVAKEEQQVAEERKRAEEERRRSEEEEREVQKRHYERIEREKQERQKKEAERMEEEAQSYRMEVEAEARKRAEEEGRRLEEEALAEAERTTEEEERESRRHQRELIGREGQEKQKKEAERIRQEKAEAQRLRMEAEAEAQRAPREKEALLKEEEKKKAFENNMRKFEETVMARKKAEREKVEADARTRLRKLDGFGGQAERREDNRKKEETSKGQETQEKPLSKHKKKKLARAAREKEKADEEKPRTNKTDATIGATWTWDMASAPRPRTFNGAPAGECG